MNGAETIVNYFQERHDFLRVYAVQIISPSGETGIDIVLRIDGTYFGQLAKSSEVESQVNYERARVIEAFSNSHIGNTEIQIESEGKYAQQITKVKGKANQSQSLAWTASELVASGRCSGMCMVASISTEKCDCRCDGEYHGALSDANVSRNQQAAAL
jgi:hypothetical protein